MRMVGGLTKSAELAVLVYEVDENGEDTGIPIIFSQWAFATGPMMKREDYTFEELLHQNDTPHAQKEPEQITLNLVSTDNQQDDEGTLIKVYPPIHYRRLKEYG